MLGTIWTTGLSGASLWVRICAQFDLPFNPIKLILLILWVYLCLYIVQFLEFSQLVPKDKKALANLVALVAGPILLPILFVFSAIRQSSISGVGFFDVLKENLSGVFNRIRTMDFGRNKGRSEIKLLDSSGNDLSQIYGKGKGNEQSSQILKLTSNLILDALDRRASDILIDPKDENNYTVRFRVDGVLRVNDELDSETCRAVINSIKAVSGMDISERRRPQDGAFMAKTSETSDSFRVASAGAMNGEKLSIRVLNSSAGTITLKEIGFSHKQREVIERMAEKPNGTMLLCGPTGSGKTTTLYSLLNGIDPYTHNIITVEDPVEAYLPDVSQIEINPRADITFEKSLRSILRQDPDVICIGEIRDEETASIALRAAQTGHLVFATLHCDSNASAIVRLLDLGISSLLIASGLSMLVSQRLLRKLCENCKERAELDKDQIAEFRKKGINYSNIYQAIGCEYCDDTGYLGRTAICDLLVLNDAIKEGISKSTAFVTQLRSDGNKKGKSNLTKQALKNVVNGITTLEELKRVIG